MLFEWSLNKNMLLQLLDTVYALNNDAHVHAILVQVCAVIISAFV